jgi:hypothetical protein
MGHLNVGGIGQPGFERFRDPGGRHDRTSRDGPCDVTAQ